VIDETNGSIDTLIDMKFNFADACAKGAALFHQIRTTVQRHKHADPWGTHAYYTETVRCK